MECHYYSENAAKTFGVAVWNGGLRVYLNYYYSYSLCALRSYDFDAAVFPGRVQPLPCSPGVVAYNVFVKTGTCECFCLHGSMAVERATLDGIRRRGGAFFSAAAGFRLGEVAFYYGNSSNSSC